MNQTGLSVLQGTPDYHFSYPQKGYGRLLVSFSEYLHVKSHCRRGKQVDGQKTLRKLQTLSINKFGTLQKGLQPLSHSISELELENPTCSLIYFFNICIVPSNIYLFIRTDRSCSQPEKQKYVKTRITTKLVLAAEAVDDILKVKGSMVDGQP